MKNIIVSTIVMCLLFLISCKKEDKVPITDTFVRAISTDSDFVSVACFQTSDNNIIAISRNLDVLTPGWIVKLTTNGEELWRKKLSSENTRLFNAIALKTGGFVTIGYFEKFVHTLKCCLYDNDGNLLSTTDISVLNNPIALSPGNLIALTNGNYMLTFSVNGFGESYITVLNSSFNTISSKLYSATNPDYFSCFFHGIQQINDSSVALSASTIFNGIDKIYSNSMLIIADLDGNEKSRTFLPDSTFSESANCLGLNNNGLVSVTSTMQGFNSGNGVFVDLYSDLGGQLICGQINLIHYDIAGNFISRKQIYSYPGNGIILSIKKCNDGGFILCGTVNLNNSQTVASNSSIYLLKLDAGYNEVWSTVFNTQYQSYGVEAFELNSGGYCLVGHQRANNKKFNMLVIKTDMNGDY